MNLKQIIIRLILFKAIIFSIITSNAQKILEENEIRTYSKIDNISLRIGDRVPDIAFKMLNQNMKIRPISSFNKRFIILDFWATWCTACISQFVKLDSLQEKFDGKLEIILVNSINTGDNEKQIVNLFSKNGLNSLKFIKSNIAIFDTEALNLFPHNTIPHYVWIDENCIIRAITNSDALNEFNIQSIIDGKNLHIDIKNDFYPDKPIELSGTEISFNESLPAFKFFKKGEN